MIIDDLLLFLPISMPGYETMPLNAFHCTATQLRRVVNMYERFIA